MFTHRRAQAGDLEAIAKLHVLSWQTAYRGFLPDRLLDSRRWEEALDSWTSTFNSYPDNLSVVTDSNGKMVGLCCAGPVVDVAKSGPFEFEIYGLHVAPEFHRQGIGRLMVGDVFQRMASLGCGSAIVWTLENLIQSRRFYEKCGGVVVKSGVWMLGNHTQNEVAYGWNPAR